MNIFIRPHSEYEYEYASYKVNECEYEYASQKADEYEYEYAFNRKVNMNMNIFIFAPMYKMYKV